MNPTIVFIHGMFLTGQSWSEWVNFFQWRGYRALAPSWPLHDVEPSELRERCPKELSELALETVVEHFARVVHAEEVSPILVGHSVGGLVVQRLIAAGLGEAGVCLAPVAPNGMLSFEGGAFRELAERQEVERGGGVFELTKELFHRDFANSLSPGEAALAYERWVVPGSRRVAADCLGPAGRVDLERPHAPLLFVGGERDRLIPDVLCEWNARAYTDPGSVSDFRLFLGRSHFIPGEPGWEEVATQVSDWLSIHAGSEAAALW